jgi:hypothetical protein
MGFDRRIAGRNPNERHLTDFNNNFDNFLVQILGANKRAARIGSKKFCLKDSLRKMEKDENPGPQPELFEEFDLAKDGSGFFLANGEFYEFDECGGFYDQWKNYYDKDGQPGQAPENEDDYEDINSDEEDGPEQDSNPKKDQSEPNPLKQIEQEIEVMVEEYEDSTEGNDHTYDDYEKIFNQNLRNEGI